jgi:protein-S-isoprenylcysteine O-methyltransferase Ste14
MEFIPAMKWGWLNGWMPIAAFYLAFGILLLVFPRRVIKNLYDVSNWSREQRILSLLGKPFALSSLVLITLTPLKIGRPVFLIGMALFGLGFIGMMVALFNYRNTLPGEPATRGLYRISRNPQWLSLAAMLTGASVAVGSGIALLLIAIATVFYHFRILGEERSCQRMYGKAYLAYTRQVPRYFWVF